MILFMDKVKKMKFSFSENDWMNINIIVNLDTVILIQDGDSIKMQ